MRVRLLEAAQAELDETISYYNAELVGLGDEFLIEFLRSLERIKNFPLAWHPFTPATRRCQLRRFPYTLIYQLVDDEVLIVAIAHMHRKPYYWGDRK